MSTDIHRQWKKCFATEGFVNTTGLKYCQGNLHYSPFGVLPMIFKQSRDLSRVTTKDRLRHNGEKKTLYTEDIKKKVLRLKYSRALHLFKDVPDAHSLRHEVGALRLVRHQNARQLLGLLRTRATPSTIHRKNLSRARVSL